MKNVILLLLFLIISTSCKDEPVEPVQLIVNGNLENGQSPWVYNTGNQNYAVSWTDEDALSPDYSLKISAEKPHDTEFAYWGQTITNSIPHGKTITMEVMIKSDLDGLGASIVLRTDAETSGLQFETTQGKVPITGTFDWTKFSITLNDVDKNTVKIYIFLVFLNDTTGEIYFDDISINY